MVKKIGQSLIDFVGDLIEGFWETATVFPELILANIVFVLIMFALTRLGAMTLIAFLA